jgi:cell division protein FtsQ
LPRLRRPGLRLIAVLVALGLLLGGAYLWLRDSSLVSVRHVTVTGVSGPDARQIRHALVTSARNMTTLDVQLHELQTAVAPYPDVKHLEVTTQFPHGMRIRVIEQVPVAIVVSAGRRIAVAGDGTLLHDVVLSPSLPTISLSVPPGGSHLTGYALSEAGLLAAAPYRMLSRVAAVSDGAAHGLVAQLRNGPSVYFGDPTRLEAKWASATLVLADAGSNGAVYIDVTDPDRPVAGG